MTRFRNVSNLELQALVLKVTYLLCCNVLTSPLILQVQLQLNFICRFQAKGERKFVYLVQVT